MESKHRRIQIRIEKAIGEHVFPGCVVGVVGSCGENIVLPFGHHTYEPDAKTVETQTVYDVASITKAIPVSSLALKLIEQGRLHVDDRLIQYIPEFDNPDSDHVLIRHLLTHTLHFAFPLSSLKKRPPEAMLQAILTTPFRSRPGELFAYANATSILLGMVVESICGESIDRLADNIFFKPLRMKKSSFHPLTMVEKQYIVPTEIDSWRGRVIQGEVHDESAWALKRPVGSAGLFSTVPDLLIFMSMLLNRGTWEGTRYFSDSSILTMSTNQIHSIGSCTGLGWELNQEHYMGRHCSRRCIGKTGFTGCMFLCDLEKHMGVVLLSNHTYPRRKGDKDLINSVRRDVADIVFA
jgi:CubicO group peptidase (beta-lactamase class C family)